MVLLYDGATPWTDDTKPADRSRLQSVKAHGGVAVSVYIVGAPGDMRCAVKRDVDAAHALGLGVLPNWERAADFFRTASLADCRDAGREALAACRGLGFPDDGTVGVAFSFDYQVPVSGYGRAADQLRACGDGMSGAYQPRGYGQIGLIDYWATRGLSGPHWLMGSTWRATSQFTAAEVGSPNVAMVQSHDAAGNWLSAAVPGTDVNTVTQPRALGAWWPTGSPYSTEVLTMEADVAARFDALEAHLDRQDQRITALFQVDVDGDGKPDITGTVQRAVQAAYNPNMLAAAIAAKIPGAQIDQVTAAVKAALDGATIQTN